MCTLPESSLAVAVTLAKHYWHSELLLQVSLVVIVLAIASATSLVLVTHLSSSKPVSSKVVAGVTCRSKCNTTSEFKFPNKTLDLLYGHQFG